MNPTDPRDAEMLEEVLAEVRRARRRRLAVKRAILPLALLAAGWLALERRPAPVPPVVAAPSLPVEVPAGSLAVVEWRDGMPSLVEYSGEELGALELTFSLEPVVAFPAEVW